MTVQTPNTSNAPRPYKRPEIPQAESVSLMRAVGQIFRTGRAQQIEIVSRLLIENSMLTKEVNEHRAALGYELLPTYPPAPHGQKP